MRTTKLTTLQDVINLLKTITEEWPENGSYPGPITGNDPGRTFNHLMGKAKGPITIEAFLLVMNLALAQIGFMNPGTAKRNINRLFKLIHLKPIQRRGAKQKPSQQELILHIVQQEGGNHWTRVQLTNYQVSSSNAWHDHRFLCLRWQLCPHYRNSLENYRNHPWSRKGTNPSYQFLIDGGLWSDRDGYLQGLSSAYPPKNVVR